MLCALHISGIRLQVGRGAARQSPCLQLVAEIFCTANGSRGLINTGLGPKTAFPNGILGGVYQTGVLTFLFILFLLPLFPCFFFISSRLDCLLSKERCQCSELDLKQSMRPS